MVTSSTAGIWAATIAREHGSAIAVLDRLGWTIADDDNARAVAEQLAATIEHEQGEVGAGRTTIANAVGDVLAEAFALGYVAGRLAELALGGG
jgi:hypothetical protein